MINALLKILKKRIKTTGKNIHLCLAASPKFEVDIDKRKAVLNENVAQKVDNSFLNDNLKHLNLTIFINEYTKIINNIRLSKERNNPKRFLASKNKGLKIYEKILVNKSVLGSIA